MTREYPSKPIVAVSVAVFCGDEVLLIKRGKAPAKGLYSLPGGGQRLGETTRQAALRELTEETGLAPAALRLVLVDALDRLQRDEEGRIQFQYVILVFATKLPPQYKDQYHAGSDAEEARWVTLEEASRLPLTEGLVDVLQAARRALSQAP